MIHSLSRFRSWIRYLDREAEERRFTTEASRSLCSAVLIRSLRDLLRYRCRCDGACHCSKLDRHLYAEAKHWIDGTSSPSTLREGDVKTGQDITQMQAISTLCSLDEYWTFDNVCEVLGWDPSWVREQIPKLHLEDVSRLDV